MGKIQQLDTITANSIAAGEVVERPASIVKELCENSIDAGASQISVEIVQGGIRSILVSDNGSGMDREDALNAFTAHATSKLRHITDLEDISSMGFRGEALPSIAAVSQVTLKTRLIGETSGTEVKIVGGELEHHIPAGTAEGTSILVEHLFFNVPARHKFLKKDATEASKISDVINRLVLARPDISFVLKRDGKVILHSPGNADLRAAVYTVFGRQVEQESIEIEQLDTATPVRISGLVGRPTIARRSRTSQLIFVNGRIIQSALINKAIEEAYKGLLMRGEFAFAVLKLDIPQSLIDVNVHPQKLEIRFWNESQVFTAVMRAVRDSLFNTLAVKEEKSIELDEIVETDKDTSTTNDLTLNKDVKDEVLLEPERVQMDLFTPREIFNENKLEESKDLVAEDLKKEQSEGTIDSSKTVSSPHIDPISVPFHEEKVETSYSVESVSKDVFLNPPKHPDLEDLKDAKIVGVLFDTYIILEHGTSYSLIDQHAAHEKILFERFLEQANSGEDEHSQQLLTGEIIRLSQEEMTLLEEEKDFFHQIGFVYEPFGEQQVILRAVPESSIGTFAADTLRHALDEMISSGSNLGLRADRDKMYLAIATAACKAAIKANDKISDMEIRALVKDLLKLENPYQCPHGRPVLIRISQKELEKRFRRIV